MAIAAPVLSETADVVSRLGWSRAARPLGRTLGLPARLTLRAAAAGDPTGVTAVHAAAAAELVERALEWHRAAAAREEPVSLATLAGDYCLARASQVLAGHTDLVVQAAFARGVAAAAAALGAGADAAAAARRLLPACGLGGAAAARLPATAQARWWRAGSTLATAAPAPPGSGREAHDRDPAPSPGEPQDRAALERLHDAGDPVQAWLGGRLLLDPPAMAGPMARLLGAGGKRLRAALVLLAAEVGPAYDPERSVVGAGAIELLHAATLCHDDLVDGASSRRGAPTVASQHGALTALAVGDHYLGRSAEVICGLGDPAIARSVTRSLVQVAEAQLRELALRRHWTARLGPYRQVAVGKTGALLSACVETGSRLGRAPAEQRRALVRFAQLLGLAFQGIDDCLDFSDPDRTGKPAGLDLAQGLCTLPVVCALRGAAREPVARALRQLDDAAPGVETERVALRVVGLVRGSGALAAARALADEWSAEALAQLATLPARARRRLGAFADRLVVRDR